jgi:predicted transcriptional regulator
MAVTLRVGTGTAAEFFERSLDRARRLDRGERLAPTLSLTFEDPADLIRAMTTKRVEIIQTIRGKAAGVSELAALLQRDRAAVNRDVQVLEALGLVRTEWAPNPGHGKRKVVRPLADRYELVTTI